LLFGKSSRGLDLEITLYSPRTNWWTSVNILYEYGVQGEQVLRIPHANYRTFRLNIYQRLDDTYKLEELGLLSEYPFGFTLFVFDIVKLVLYTVYFGQQNIKDLRFFYN
jgi:hypothetical protein